MSNSVKVTNNRRFSSYNSLYKAIEKTGIKSGGKTARLLLETFLENNGRLLASTIYAKGLCEENDFRNWRKKLIDKGWLVWSETQDDKGQYYAGKKLVTYLNREKFATKEIATVDQIASKLDVQDLKERMCKMEEAMTKVYNNLNLGPIDPPGYSKLVENSSKTH